MTSLLLLAVLSQEELDFRPIYKPNQKFSYTATHEIMGQKSPTDWEGTVKSVQGETATIHYKWTNTDSSGTKKRTVELTTPVGPINMPNAATSGLDGGAVQVLIVGITPGTKVKPGEEVSVTWSTNEKSFSVTGKGTIGTVNQQAKTVPIDWNLNLTAPGMTKPAVVKQKTIYSTQDFSMVQSEGTIFMEQFNMTIKFVAKKKV